jgi:undecaprenyl diphosphate synthase
MRLLRHFLVVERDELAAENIRLVMIGEREGLPSDVLAEMDRTVEMTHNNTGMTLALAVNYGGRTEIAKAARRIAEKVARGEMIPSDINEAVFNQHLDTAGMPDPDLLIRTAGEMRVSNYLLWQISYSELWVTETYWPDFREPHLAESFRAYAGRKRKFGGLIKS